MTTGNQEFSPGEKVMLRHVGPGIYPDTPCTVIEKMVDKLTPCHVCGNPWYGCGGPDYWKNRPTSYLIEYPTGSRSIVPVPRIKSIEGSAPCVAKAEGASDGANDRRPCRQSMPTQT